MPAITIVKQHVPEDLQEHYFGIEWLNTEDLIVDTNYQRPVKHALVKAISEAWDWRAVRTLAVSLRLTDEGNIYAVIDGQQRLMAARECDIKKLPCQVYVDLSEKQEAELFLKLNNSSKPSANDMFRAKLAEGDEEAKLIMMALNNTGWGLDLEKTQRKDKYGFTSKTVNSATALTNIYRNGGILHLQSVLNLAHGWYGQHLAASSDILNGISGFLLKYKGQVDMTRLTEKLAEETPSSLLGKAIQLMAAERAMYLSGQSTRYKSLTRVILGVYNKGLRVSNKLEE